MSSFIISQITESTESSIPAWLNPLTATLGLLVKVLQEDIIQFALFTLTAAAATSTVTKLIEFHFSTASPLHWHTTIENASSFHLS